MSPKLNQPAEELRLLHKTDPKAERFIQTVTREWAYARLNHSSSHRATFLPYYLHDYNFHRPHSALQFFTSYL